MAFVADNSVIVGWFVESQSNTYSRKLARQPLPRPGGIAPPLLFSFASLAAQLFLSVRIFCRTNSTMPGMIDSTMMPRMNNVRFCLTTGMLPK